MVKNPRIKLLLTYFLVFYFFKFISVLFFCSNLFCSYATFQRFWGTINYEYYTIRNSEVNFYEVVWYAVFYYSLLQFLSVRGNELWKKIGPFFTYNKPNSVKCAIFYWKGLNVLLISWSALLVPILLLYERKFNLEIDSSS